VDSEDFNNVLEDLKECLFVDGHSWRRLLRELIAALDDPRSEETEALRQQRRVLQSKLDTLHAWIVTTEFP
jgi:hypothetical protein